MFNKILYPIILLFLLAFYPYIPKSMDKPTMTLLLGVGFVALLLFFNRKESIFSLRKHYLKHSFLFLLGYIIVHFQYPIDFILGNVSESNFFIWVNKSIVVKSLYLSLIGLISFIWGYCLYKNKPKASRVKAHEIAVPTQSLVWISAILLALYFYTVNPLYLIGYYGSVSMGTTATYVILLFKIFIFAVLIQNIRNMRLKNIIPSSINDYIRHQGIFLLILIIIYLLSVMFSGDRGPIISFSIAYVAGYYYVTGKKLPLIKTGILAISAALFITILGMTRSLDKNMSFSDRFKDSIGQSQFKEPSILPQTTELSGSIRTFHTVVDYVPDRHPHTLGRFQLQQIAATIPFTSSLLSFLPDSDQYRFRSPASFVTWIIQGDNPTSGAGTTSNADLYVEFGLLGILVGMFLFGMFMRYSEVTFYKVKLPLLFPHIFTFVYLCDALFISRSSILFGFRTVVWIYVVLLINRFIFTHR